MIIGLDRQTDKDPNKRSSIELNNSAIQWASASPEGRVGALRGHAGNERNVALMTSAGVWGAFKAGNPLKILVAAHPYTWWVSREDDRIKIKGHVPSKDYRRTILGLIKATLPDMAIDDRMKRADGAPRGGVWIGAISFALKQIDQLKRGTARLDNTAFSLVGEARSAAAYNAVKAALANRLPKGVELKFDGVTPPEVRPFAWLAELKDGTLTLNGHVPEGSARLEAVRLARKLFHNLPVADHMEMAAGAPEGWGTAVQVSLRQLSRLEAGKVEMSDASLIMTGTAGDDATAADVAKAFRGGLPAIYKSSEDIRVGRTSLPAKKQGSGTTAESVAPRAGAPKPGDSLADKEVGVARTGPPGKPGPGQISAANLCQQDIDAMVRSNKIEFEHARDRLLKNSYRVLNGLAEIAKRCQGTQIVIRGHTDTCGDALSNLHLSQRRADAVVKYLIAKGIVDQRLVAIGLGDTHPIAANDTDQNKARNRRIEFEVRLTR